MVKPQIDSIFCIFLIFKNFEILDVVSRRRYRFLATVSQDDELLTNPGEEVAAPGPGRARGHGPDHADDRLVLHALRLGRAAVGRGVTQRRPCKPREKKAPHHKGFRLHPGGGCRPERPPPHKGLGPDGHDKCNQSMKEKSMKNNNTHKKSQKRSQKHYVYASKWFTLMWGLIAIMFANFGTLFENLIQLVNIIGSIFYGTILGIFLVAFFSKGIKGNNIFWAACASQVLVFVIYGFTEVGYLWLNFFGAFMTIIFSIVLKKFQKG